MARKDDFTDSVDFAVSAKIRELRLAMGLSGMQFAAKIGVTHQQVQKYEKGTNRISAGRLAAIAKALDKEVAFFFDDTEVETLPTRHQTMCLQVSRNFLKIKNPQQQDAVNKLVRTLAQD